MKVFALTFKIGISSGSETLLGVYMLGLFSTLENAVAVKNKHSKEHGYAEYHYEIIRLELDKEVNITLAEC